MKLTILIFTIAFLGLIASNASASVIVRSPNNFGLVGYWNFDIGAGGSTVYDMSGNAKHGTLTLMDPATDWVDGKIGSGALDFDGSNDYVDMGSQPDLRFNSGNFTLASWVKPDDVTYAVQSGNIMGNLQTSSGGYQIALWNDKLGYYTNAWKLANTTLSVGIWYHVAITVNSSGNYIFYLNGVADGSGASTLPGANEDTFKIGAYNAVLAGRINGLIDEARVYNRALSAEEIQRLYKTTAGTKIKPSLSNGLVGYWNFDIGAGGSTVYDMSGNAKHGTMVNMDPATDWVDGKIGSGALDFDGSNDYVDIGLQPDLEFNSGNFTIAGWVKPDGVSAYNTMAGNSATNEGYYFGIFSNQIYYYVNGWRVGSTVLSNGIWYHIAVTVGSSGNYVIYLNGVADGSGAAPLPTGIVSTFMIGANKGYFNGLIDDVRVYNRALSAEEIQRLYKTTAGTKIKPALSNGLVGYWNFDIGAGGSTVYDMSGNAKHGTMVNMDPATDWVDGKVGSGSLDFDGSNDYVNIGSQPDLRFNSGNFTLMAWVKLDDVTYTQSGTIMGNIQTPSSGYNFAVDVGKFGYYTNAWRKANTTISVGIWYHLAVTIDSSGNYIFYLNGVADGSGASTLPAANEGTFKIGTYNAALTDFIDGLIDEARVYNRALSADEIILLYNMK